jgi:VanZ family protein
LNKHPQNPSPAIWFIAIAYALLIAYGSLFPLSGWRSPPGDVFAYLGMGIPYLGRSDFVLNVLVYIPVGLFFLIAFRRSFGSGTAVLLATLTGILLSFSMETLQVFLPNRSPGIIDLITNTMGTFFGALLSHLAHGKTSTGQRLHALREHYFLQGSWVNMGLLILGLWALMHLSPIVVTLDMGKIRQGLAPTWHLLQDPSLFRGYSFFSSFMFFIGLNITVRQMVKPGRPAIALFFFFSLAVLLAKVFVISRQISPEQILALLAATLFTSFLTNPRTNAASRMAVIAIGLGYIISQLAPSTDIVYTSTTFNWIPFKDQNANLNGISSILENIWPFMAIGYLLHISIQETQRKFVLIVGGLFVALLAFSMEWMQQDIPGRTADISAVIVAIVGWIIPLSNRLNFSNTHQPEISAATNTTSSRGNLLSSPRPLAGEGAGERTDFAFLPRPTSGEKAGERGKQ